MSFDELEKSPYFVKKSRTANGMYYFFEHRIGNEIPYKHEPRISKPDEPINFHHFMLKIGIPDDYSRIRYVYEERINGKPIVKLSDSATLGHYEQEKFKDEFNLAKVIFIEKYIGNFIFLRNHPNYIHDNIEDWYKYKDVKYDTYTFRYYYKNFNGGREIFFDIVIPVRGYDEVFWFSWHDDEPMPESLENLYEIAKDKIEKRERLPKLFH